MSLFYFFIFLFVSVCFYNNFKRTLILYTPFKLIFHSLINLVDSNIVVNLDLAISIVAFLIFISFYPGRKVSKEKLPSILVFGWSVYLFGLLIHAMNPQFKPTLFVYEAITTFLYCYMLFKMINTKKDISRLCYVFILVSIILFIDGMIDVLFGVNVITNFEQSQAVSRFWHSSNSNMRAGVARTTSFMPHALTMGAVATLLWGFLYLISVEGKIKLRPPLLYTTLVCLIFCVIFSNSRSSLIAFLFLLPVFVMNRKMGASKKMTLLLVLVLISLIYIDYFQWMYDSIFHEKTMNVQGSTSDLRENQFNAALYYMMKSPILGQGNTFQILNFENEREVAGMESVWFPIMMQQGMVGILSYVTLLFSVIHFLWKNSLKIHIFYVLSWIAIITLSSQVGLSLFMLVVFPIIAYKTQKIKKRLI